MSGDDIAKVTPARLRRDAYLYLLTEQLGRYRSSKG